MLFRSVTAPMIASFLPFLMPWDDDTITPKIILEHLQAMRNDLGGRIDRLEKRMDGRFARLEQRLDAVEERLNVIEQDIRHVKDALQRLYTHRVHMLARIETLEEKVGIRQ